LLRQFTTKADWTSVTPSALQKVPVANKIDDLLLCIFCRHRPDHQKELDSPRNYRRSDLLLILIVVVRSARISEKE
jgi:hypothetical protein